MAGKARSVKDRLIAPFRRVVPAGYAEATLILTGTSPLMMNSGEADQDGEAYRAYFHLGQKRGKSLDDAARLRELEWQLRIHLDDTLGPFIPGANVKELLRESATKWRKGEEIKRSLISVLYRIPLIYDGPRDQQGLWDAGFRDTRMVKNNGASGGRVIRCRPKFEEWSLEAELAYDPEDLDIDFLGMVVDRSRKYGFGDGRSIGFGSFEAELVPGIVHKSGAFSDAVKGSNGLESVHDALRDRIMVKAGE